MEWTGRGESTYKEDRIAIGLLICSNTVEPYLVNGKSGTSPKIRTVVSREYQCSAKLRNP